MNILKITVLSLVGVLAFAAQAVNYDADWSKGNDLLSADVWKGNDPTTMGTGDNLLMGASKDVVISKTASINPTIVESTANAVRNADFGAYALTVPLLRTMGSGIKWTLSGGTANFGKVYWPDREGKNNNVFTATGSGTRVDFGSLYFGYNLASSPGAGAGNQVIVRDGAFAAAELFLGARKNSSGRPNGFYVTGTGTVFSNKATNGRVSIANADGAESCSNEFVIADGAIVRNFENFTIGATDSLAYGEGHLLAFRDSNTVHEFSNNSTLGRSHRLEIDGATVMHMGLQQWGRITVTNGGRFNANLPIGDNARTLITGTGSVFSNVLVVADDGHFAFQRSNVTTNTVFEVADGAKLENIGRFKMFGSGNRVIFSGVNTDQTLLHSETASAGFSEVAFGNSFEVLNGAKVRFANAKGTAKANNRIRLRGDLVVAGKGGLLDFDTTSAMVTGGATSPTSCITVADGAVFDVGGGLNLSGDGGTNACLFVRNGGAMTAAVVRVGYASDDVKYEQAPYGCVMEISGSGSAVACTGLLVGDAEQSGTAAKGCCTNGHDNVVSIRNGGTVISSGDVTIGNTCSSNLLEVIRDGRLETKGNVYIGRAESAPIGSTKAQFCAVGNGCVVADGGVIEAAGLLSIRGNGGYCCVTNGVLHTVQTNNFETMANTGYIQIAGTNSLIKGDLATRLVANYGKIGFALPFTGYVRAPIQSDCYIQFNNTTRFEFVPPAEEGKLSGTYVLIQVPVAGELVLGDSVRNSLRAAFEDLRNADSRFNEYSLRFATEDGFRRVEIVPRKGLAIVVR